VRAQDADAPTFRARIAASSENLLGQSEQIGLREISENERTSYFGTFSFVPKGSQRFEIEVRPGKSLEVFTPRFEERLLKTRR
jgi:hypothetical protein